MSARTCELCGNEFQPDDTTKICSCGGDILPKVKHAKKKEEPAPEPKVECPICSDTGHVGINTPEGIEIWNCPRQCPPLILKLKLKT